ncbi:MAG TPA: OmpH family outer membrane protein [Candidatus Aminicenantes bacterium]|nr:OmpH family outer membrane protein [Candidatus Aminicenantes bacterium]
MRRHLRLIALFAAAAAACAGLAAAQTAGRLGTINSHEILDKSAEGQRAYGQLEARNKKYAEDIARLDDQIRQLQNRLSTQRLTLTPDAAASLQADLARKQTERQRAAEDAAQAMRELQVGTMERIQNELLPVIEQVRKDMGLECIFDLAKGSVVYFNPALDVTAEVIKRYDALKAAPPAKK